MLSDVVKVEPRGGSRIWLQFQDGVEGEVDLGPRLTFQGCLPRSVIPPTSLGCA